MPARLAILMLLAAVAAPGVARAQRGPPGYRRAVVQALREFDEGRWEEARALFRRAHELYPNARTARGIGMTSFELRDYVGAHDMLTEALASSEVPLTATLRRETEELLGRARAFLGRYVFVVDPGDATITVDGAPPESRLDGTVLLPIGEHEVVARLDGHDPVVRRVVVEGGEEETVRLAFVAPPAPVAAPAPPAVSSELPVVGMVVMVAAVAPLGATLGGVGWIVDREDELARCQGVPAHQACLNEGTIAGERDASVAFTVAMGVTTAAALGVGLALLVVGLGETTAAESALRCAPGIGGVACAGRF